MTNERVAAREHVRSPVTGNVDNESRPKHGHKQRIEDQVRSGEPKITNGKNK